MWSAIAKDSFSVSRSIGRIGYSCQVSGVRCQVSGLVSYLTHDTLTYDTSNCRYRRPGFPEPVRLLEGMRQPQDAPVVLVATNQLNADRQTFGCEATRN